MAKGAAAASGASLDRLPPIAKAGVGLVFFVLVGLLYFVVFYGDIDTQAASERQREESLTNELATAQGSKEQYQKDLDEKTRREQLVREQQKILPDDSETPSFLSAVQGVATLSGVALVSWSPTAETALEFYAKVPMKLRLRGKFHQVAKFFHSVGQLDRIINIENIQITKPKAAGADVEVEVECLATAFRAVRAGEGAKKGAAPKPPAPAPGGH